MSPRGRVLLVGAGPGDPELLTLGALRALERADVVLYDALVDPRVLALAPEHARRVDVGKRGGCKSTPQAFIERLAAREARAGRTVVRLKGGDPFVFGRGGEELRRLAARGIEVRVVPGITSGLAAAAGAGIPVTDREACSGVALVAGHTAPGAPQPDWSALARCGLTLVIYMGAARCAQIAAALIAGGLAERTHAAFVHSAWREEEHRHYCTLGELARGIARPASPAIIVIGDAVRYAAAAARGARRAAAAP